MTILGKVLSLGRAQKDVRVGGVVISLLEPADSPGGNKWGKTSQLIKIKCTVSSDSWFSDEATNLIKALFVTYKKHVAHSQWSQLEITSISLETIKCHGKGFPSVSTGTYEGELMGGGHSAAFYVQGEFTANLYPDERRYGSVLRVKIGFMANANGLYSRDRDPEWTELG